MTSLFTQPLSHPRLLEILQEQITYLGLEEQYLLSENKNEERMRENLNPKIEAFKKNPRCLGYFFLELFVADPLGN